MNDYQPVLRWIDGQRDRMESLVAKWAAINSGSFNLVGLAQMADELKSEFACLGGEMQTSALPPVQTIAENGKLIDTPLAQALHIRKRPNAPIKIFLGIHMDTVYGINHPFQQVTKQGQRLVGPGVIDAKGGLCIMLIALQALERSDYAQAIGWEVLINPDEEIGSSGSSQLFVQAAQRNQIGLVFEPAQADGMLVSERKGSGNFSAVIQGRSAHAGRDFKQGRNAIVAAAKLTVALEELNGKHEDVTVNIGKIDGGGPTNIVPDLAIVRFNVRVPNIEVMRTIVDKIDRAVQQANEAEGITVQLYGSFTSPPKVMNDETLALLKQIASCGKELGMNLTWRSSGGASDGNKLAAAGLPVVDTLGPRGGNMHSPGEFLELESLTERAKLAAIFLMRAGSGEMRLR